MMTTEQGFANGLDTLVVDIGHNHTKAYVVRNGAPFFGCEFPTAIAEIDESHFTDLISAKKETSGAYPQYIGYKDRYYVVGRDAESTGAVIRVERQQRYTRQYYGILLASIILSIYGDEIPEHMNVFAGYPPSEHREKEMHVKSMIGKWSILTSKGRVSYTIDFVSRYPEVIGGAMNLVLAPDGQRYEDHPILWDGPTVVLDVGGGTTDITVLDETGMPKYTVFASAPVGINNVVAQYIHLFGEKYPEIIESNGRKPLSFKRATDSFLDPSNIIRLPSGDIDGAELFKRSTAKTMNQIVQAYETILKQGSLDFNHALVSGGGGGLLLDAIRERVFSVFSNNNLHTSDKRPDMIYANVKGAAKMVVAMTNVSPRIKRNVR